jgi:hypothetical protein
MNGNKRVPRLTVAARRRIIGVVIALAVAELIAVATGTWLVHRNGAVTFGDTFFPVLGVVSGLLYLHSTRGRS